MTKGGSRMLGQRDILNHKSLEVVILGKFVPHFIQLAKRGVAYPRSSSLFFLYLIVKLFSVISE